MIPDLDIFRSAQVLVKRYGEDAPIYAAADSGLRLLYCPPGSRALGRPFHPWQGVKAPGRRRPATCYTG